MSPEMQNAKINCYNNFMLTSVFRKKTLNKLKQTKEVQKIELFNTTKEKFVTLISQILSRVLLSNYTSKLTSNIKFGIGVTLKSKAIFMKTHDELM